ncbi:TPA: hypothetical protein SLG40_003215 [Serratia odorifera]|nr:hypothetical protein [Serratia odorifera]
MKSGMNFRMVVIVLLAILFVESCFYFPRILARDSKNPVILRYIKEPESVYKVFSECKKNVVEVDRCYMAYSAAVLIADSKDCSKYGIKVKRRFKLLLENNKLNNIDEEIARECASDKV